MASKLDQSLDEIAGGRRNARRTRKPAPVASGGIAKKAAPTKPAKSTRAAPATAPSLSPKGDSKIIVSNLPDDVNEQQIKEYFSSTVGAVRRVLMSYTKTGRSTGVATIIFSQPTSAAEAAKTYDGVKVDGKPMKIEVVMGAQYVPKPPAPKTLKDRIAAPKAAAGAKPKSAAAPKTAATNGKTPAARGGRGGARGRGGRGGARPTKKTVEQLDADMADYFNPGEAPAVADAGAATNGTAPAANGGDSAMVEDEIL